MDTFSLLDRDWVPVVSFDGVPTQISLRESLMNAGKYRRIDAGHPLQTAALYRLHLAVLHRALGGPQNDEQAAGWYRDRCFPDDLRAYLDRYADRFYLFGPQPFMQVTGLDPVAVGENFRSHWVRLSAEEGSANTTALYNVETRPGGDRTDALTPAQAALRLLEHQTFALGGLIKRFTTSAKAAPVATVALFLAEGADLHQTLCLNLVRYTGGPEDAPPWERPPVTVADIRALYASERGLARVPAGPVSRSTWLSRSILLLPEETEAGTVVRTIGFGAGEPFEGPGEGVTGNIDPMVTLRTGEQSFPYKLRRDRLLWRDFEALFPDPAATVEIPNKKGRIKLLPGKAPETLLHARRVLRRVVDAAPAEDDDLELSQDVSATPLASVAESRASTLGVQPVVPVMVFGQLTDQGKAFAMRQESYTLPEAFIEDPVKFREFVQTALRDAGTVGEGLRRSVHFLAQALLKKDGDREPHPDDVKKLAGQIPAAPTYWAGLDTPFRTYLLALDGDPKAALSDWHAALRHSARAGWRTAEEAAGMNAVGLRAVEKARGPLGKALGAITPEEKNDAGNP